MLKKIISGGQTGVDTAALEAAISLGFEHGGWCPKGRLNESGTINNQYRLFETITPDPSERTKKNIQEADGTLILVPSMPLTVNDGTVLTLQIAEKSEKPFLTIDLSKAYKNDYIEEWLTSKKIITLNIAGPRESQSKGIHDIALKFLSNALTSISPQKKSVSTINLQEGP